MSGIEGILSDESDTEGSELKVEVERKFTKLEEFINRTISEEKAEMEDNKKSDTDLNRNIDRKSDGKWELKSDDLNSEKFVTEVTTAPTRTITTNPVTSNLDNTQKKDMANQFQFQSFLHTNLGAAGGSNLPFTMSNPTVTSTPENRWIDKIG